MINYVLYMYYILSNYDKLHEICIPINLILKELYMYYIIIKLCLFS